MDGGINEFKLLPNWDEKALSLSQRTTLMQIKLLCDHTRMSVCLLCMHVYQEMVYCTGSNSCSQKPYIACCAQGIAPRLCENEFQNHR